ncbi:MAG: OmpA family protein [Oligoflexia bacterium]|nr:OmpA family protein [Oligoflexia bacterium]
MKTSAKLFFIITTVGIFLMLGYYFAKPFWVKKIQISSSDAGQAEATLTIGVDSWAGYLPLCSGEMRKRLLSKGLLLQCENDNGNYAERMQKLYQGKLDFAVATVDSYILNAAQYDFPGSIIMVIDESKGGDAIVALKDKISKLDQLKTKQGWKIAFTPASPSEHLLKSISSHFDLQAIRNKKGAWRVEVSGSEEARKRLEAGEVDLAVLWEPDISKVLASEKMVKLIGTEDTRRLIVDILVVNRKLAKDHPEWVKKLLMEYFNVLKFFRDNPQSLVEEIRSQSKISEEQALQVLQGVRFVNLTENARDWFGIPVNGQGKDGLVSTIESTVEILLEHHDFKQSPLPERDPYRLQYRTFVEELVSDLTQFGNTSEQLPSGSGGGFPPLTPEQWEALMEIGTLRIRPIPFKSGTMELDENGEAELDLLVQNQLYHYPNFRILVTGHTGSRGDRLANQELSLQRAEAVKKYLLEKHNLDTNRIHCLGMGSERPLPQDPGESERSFEYRLPRVELKLLAPTI